MINFLLQLPKNLQKVTKLFSIYVKQKQSFVWEMPEFPRENVHGWFVKLPAFQSVLRKLWFILMKIVVMSFKRCSWNLMDFCTKVQTKSLSLRKASMLVKKVVVVFFFYFLGIVFCCYGHPWTKKKQVPKFLPIINRKKTFLHFDSKAPIGTKLDFWK